MHDMAAWLPFISPIEKAWHSDIFYDIMVNTYVCFPLLGRDYVTEVNGIGRFRKSKDYDEACCF